MRANQANSHGTAIHEPFPLGKGGRGPAGGALSPHCALEESVNSGLPPRIPYNEALFTCGRRLFPAWLGRALKSLSFRLEQRPRMRYSIKLPRLQSLPGLSISDIRVSGMVGNEKE